MSNALITFVNHASVIFSHKDIRLMTDPWLFGSAFNNGWELLSKSKFQLNDFAKITHIWFSHEHPDHFHPGVLSKIPEDLRKKITILFQDTLDHRVAKKCMQLNFKSVIEMIPNEYIKLNDEFKIVMRYPTVKDTLSVMNINSATESAFLIIKNCIDTIMVGEEIYNRVDISQKELDEFFNSMTQDMFEKLQTFFESMPKLRHELEVTNPKTEVTSTITMEGLADFFD